MPTRVRSYSKINLGLAIGAPRADGFHGLATLYQTLALQDVVTVSARATDATRIVLSSNDRRVPADARNTAWKMVEKALAAMGVKAEVQVHIQKNLPVQGGMGAGSANAAAALVGLERELGLALPQATRLRLAAEVGSDVPLFLVGGSVLGSDRGQVVEPTAEVTLAGSAEIACCVALPAVGVSTPAAFRDWDRLLVGEGRNGEAGPPPSAKDDNLGERPAKDDNRGERSVKDDSSFARHFGGDLHIAAESANIEKLSRTYASVLRGPSQSGASGIFPDPSELFEAHTPEKQQGLSREQRHGSLEFARTHGESGIEDDLAENTLLALVRTGIENDFETVVFPQYPLLRELKRHLMGSSADGNAAVYAALSGSGSALFGLYRSTADATAAQQRLQQVGVEAIVTRTIPRTRYWSEMFAE